MADLFKANFPEFDTYHELFTTDSWGINTPEISDIHEFNNYGNTRKVKDFWHRKFSFVKDSKAPWYIETSHVNGKAGLIENIWNLRTETHVVHLTRASSKIMQSFHNRFDFMNIGNAWMWYLDWDYSRNLVNPKPFLEQFKGMEIHGWRLWYIIEMEARAAHYKKHYTNIIWHTIDINDLNDKKKVQSFFKELGLKKHLKDIILPKNENKSEIGMPLGDDVKEKILNFLGDYAKGTFGNTKQFRLNTE
ncbi:MAG: hypothetical protein KKF27_21595 [Gammaproteobacteria bacterium]|nr:hypothetical protein [Gammaproteobacteria bacterium]